MSVNISNFFSGSRIFFLFWLAISLGSCSMSHFVDNSTFIYNGSLGRNSEQGCAEFKRTVRIDHHRPTFPKVDIRRLSVDERTDLLLSFTERLKKYLDNEERYMAEDLIRHQASCQKPDQVFQK